MIRVDVKIPVLGDIEVGVVQAAVQAQLSLAGQAAKQLWTMRAQAMDIRRSGAYLRGIALGDDSNVQMVAVANGAQLEAALSITNTAPHAWIVEVGHAPFSLPASINWSAGGGSIKRSKDGTPYLTIPFEHSAYATPKQAEDRGLTRATRSRMMTSDVYARAKKLTPTNRNNAGPQFGPGGAAGGAGQVFKQRDTYTRGERLRDPRPPSSSSTDSFGRVTTLRRGAQYVGVDNQGRTLTNPGWGSSRFDGMIRSTQTVAGGGEQSSYRTLRTITPNSLGFRIPAQIGKYVIRQVREELSSGPTGAALAEMMRDAARDAVLRQLYPGSP